MIRPTHFGEFMGQPQAVKQLSVPVEAARKLGRPLGHVLLSGPHGLGKSTLGGHVLPTEMNATSKTRTVNCAAVEEPQDLLPTLLMMEEGGILFLDEIHRLPKQFCEQLYSVMEDRKLTILTGDERNRQAMVVDLPAFTIIGATTREGLLPDPLRDRFKHSVKLVLYSDRDMETVLVWTGFNQQVDLRQVTRSRMQSLVKACHGTARIAVMLIDALVDTVVVSGGPTPPFRVENKDVEATLDRLGFSKNGLSKAERTLLNQLHRSDEGTVGLGSLSRMLDEEQDTVELVYEPWLLQQGYIAITSKGRKVTDAGLKALKEAGGFRVTR
jgi:Holliday junction DNA helicase RuvB